MDVGPYKATVPEAIKRSLNKVARVTGLGRPLVSLMLIEAICEQAGYSGDEEVEARGPKNRDIINPDQETEACWLHLFPDTALSGNEEFPLRGDLMCFHLGATFNGCASSLRYSK
ncbi:hypothetical protein CNMCM5793_008363 [Aspergillus hiratsukae]|uniref:Uncharacterized protein n=1 Tax=Aspergillus hiratsukae TaxID=1194566 RepID=A0A8H6UC62_9EURO|nr:hypothetical protein CNMCM5793_008363 [Aspergillus hiratsukae]KAF7159325.1 hypothetical protein CNMCM6106_006538 [Aspergillus hiratsukae]